MVEGLELPQPPAAPKLGRWCGVITGHRAKELIAHYSHKHPGSVARAAEALEKINGKRE